MKDYLLLRLRTQTRQWAELGWWRAALLLVLLAAAGRQLWLVLATQPAAQWAVPPLLALAVVGGHRQRADLTFLQLTAPQYRRWLMGEYVVLGLLGAAWLLPFGYWWSALLTVLLPPLAVLLPPAAERTARTRRSLVRAEAFEWVSGLRRRTGWLLWLVLLAVAVWQREQSAAPALCLVAWLLLVTSFYDVPEPVEMLLSAARSPGQWLRGRLGWAVLYFGLTAAPFLVLLGLGAASWGGAAALLLWCLTVLTLVILAKYTFYPHVTIMRYAQGAVVALGFLILVHSVYAALLAAALVGLVWRSRYRLRTYRYD
ncbi:hypothetical protein [Hymenobacter jeollabukensis]|uniref:Uncharacterized protein n=1 Tax=Hymenobacter jeollabukensis TaxID=2025313 RepID=A0A5R8WVZ0_9BACT|nr:hypothetical protein [Hymenobacter jeollabukensis]TLM96668.1 hypothetical protein FDY95_01345 [Hymenobacter jeollabukensis]